MDKIDYSKILEADYQNKVKLLKDKTNILHFSTGADSVASFLRLREAGIEPILIYKYFIPNLKMVDNYIDYFQNKFNVRVYQLPHPLFTEMFGNIQYQKPTNYFIKLWCTYGNMVAYTKEYFDDILNKIFSNKDFIYHFGLRYTDGIRRLEHLKKNGVMFRNKFYPIASFKIGDIQAILKKHNCKLPIEYSLWGISFESPRAWSLPLIKENCPITYKQILDYFPVIEYSLYRGDFNKLNRHFLARLKQFKDFAIDKKMYKEW